MKPVYIIAEIGINHNGDIDKAIKLIDIAASSGCDAVKFQKRNPNICIPEKQKTTRKMWKGTEMSYLEYKHLIEFGKQEFDIIDKHCRNRGIIWSASPWDYDSIEFLKQYDLPFIKIPSAMLSNHELLTSCMKSSMRVIVSTGMSSEQEIEQAVNVLRKAKHFFKNPHTIGLLHCNSSYPAPVEELNLSVIKTLKEKYTDCEIGYSGHELLLGTSVAAVYLGATIIERHITLDRNMEGSDHSCSITPHGLFKLVSGIRELEQAYGDGKIKVTESEKIVREKLRG
jgi:N-acetylneuraminate synthase